MRAWQAHGTHTLPQAVAGSAFIAWADFVAPGAPGPQIGQHFRPSLPRADPP